MQTDGQREMYAERARQGWEALVRSFRARRGGLRRDGRLRLPWASAHLWPFSGALSAALALAGVDGERWSDVDWLMEALERYWQPDREVPAYSSDAVRGTLPWTRSVGGDLYYDDNAWIALALVQLERMRSGSADMSRALELFRFAQSGWDRARGGVYWVEQGRGLGSRNHDRNLVSTAPNAALGLHLLELGALDQAELGDPAPEAMYRWILDVLDEGGSRGRTGSGLFWDKVTSDGSIDRMIWSYNQGSMVALNVLLARAEGQLSGGEGAAVYRARAEAIARASLSRFASGEFARQPAAFSAILFRNLLMLEAKGELALEIESRMCAYVDDAWNSHRDPEGLFNLGGGPVTLLDQSAMVELQALLAWPPEQYRLLA